MSALLALYGPSSAPPLARDKALRHLRAMQNRGPDHQGIWVDPEFPLCLAHQRLVLRDQTDHGIEPMMSAGRRYVAMIDGMLDNAATLRDELRGHSIVFKGRSDTEVLLAATEHWGLNATLQKIRGAFALVIYDRHHRQVHLVRDPLGHKPIYVGWVGDALLVASTLHPFLSASGTRPEVNPSALAHFLHAGFVPAPLTILSDVTKPPPGHRQIISLTGLKPGGALSPPEPYLLLALMADPTLHRPSGPSQIQKLLTQTIDEQRAVDGSSSFILTNNPASWVMTALSEQHHADPCITHSLSFDPTIQTQIERIAHQLGTVHHAHQVTDNDVRGMMETWPQIADEPLADTALLRHTLLARAIKPQATVAITDIGADIIGGDFSPYRRLASIYALGKALPWAMKPVIVHLMRRLSGLLPLEPSVTTPAATLLSCPDLTTLYDATLTHGLGPPLPLMNGPPPPLAYPFDTTSPWPTRASVEQWLRFADLTYLVPGKTLAALDRGTQHLGLQARAPFLDLRLLALTWNIDTRARASIWRDMAARFISRDLSQVPAQNDAPPIDRWLRGVLAPQLYTDLHDPDILPRLGLNPAALQALWTAHQQGSQVVAPLWRLMVLANWARGI